MLSHIHRPSPTTLFLFLALILQLSSYRQVYAIPITSSLNSNSLLDAYRALYTDSEPINPNEGPAGTVPLKRTLWNVVYTCFATTVACTWVAMHPNIPRNNRRRTSILTRVLLAACALIVPEVIAFWAVVQWRAARDYAKYFKEGKSKVTEDWTITHGFFLAMGGFTIPYETVSGKVLHRTLPAKEFKYLLENNLIVVGRIREMDLLDRSKGDPLAKIVAMLQTLWFALQILARFRQGLVITELEIITFALVPLNVATYCFWLNKPLSIKLAIPLKWANNEVPSLEVMQHHINQALKSGDPPITDFHDDSESKGEKHAADTTLKMIDSATVTSPATDSKVTLKGKTPSRDDTTPIDKREPRVKYEKSYDKMPRMWIPFWRDEPDDYPVDPGHASSKEDSAESSSTTTSNSTEYSPRMLWKRISVRKESEHIITCIIRIILTILLGFVIAIIVAIALAIGLLIFISPFVLLGTLTACVTIILSPIIAAIAFRAIGNERNTLSGAHRKLRMFYAPELKGRPYNYMVTISVVGATIFGGLHVLAWNFEFPTPMEHILWRISCITLTGLPIIFFVFYFIFSHLFPRGAQGIWTKTFYYGVLNVGAFAYALARCFVIVEAVIALRIPTQGTLDAVRWSTFIPHI